MIVSQKHTNHTLTNHTNNFRCGDGVTADLVFGEFEIHALALRIDNAPNLSGTERVQVECGPQPEQTRSLNYRWNHYSNIFRNTYHCTEY